MWIIEAPKDQVEVGSGMGMEGLNYLRRYELRHERVYYILAVSYQ